MKRRDETLQERIERVKREVNISLDKALGKEPILPLYPLRCPELNLDDVEGMLALRFWHLTDGLRLGSTAVRNTWKTINYADKVPEENNNRGLYAILLSPSYSNDCNVFYRGHNQISGIVEVRGKIIIHKDGVIRAEWARILNIMIPVRMLMPEERQDYGTRKHPWVTIPPKVDEYVIRNLHQVYGIMPQVVDETSITELTFKAILYNISSGHVRFRDERR